MEIEDLTHVALVLLSMYEEEDDDDIKTGYPFPVYTMDKFTVDNLCARLCDANVRSVCAIPNMDFMSNQNYDIDARDENKDDQRFSYHPAESNIAWW